MWRISGGVREKLDVALESYLKAGERGYVANQAVESLIYIAVIHILRLLLKSMMKADKHDLWGTS